MQINNDPNNAYPNKAHHEQNAIQKNFSDLAQTTLNRIEQAPNRPRNTEEAQSKEELLKVLNQAKIGIGGADGTILSINGNDILAIVVLLSDKNCNSVTSEQTPHTGTFYNQLLDVFREKHLYTKPPKTEVNMIKFFRSSVVEDQHGWMKANNSHDLRAAINRYLTPLEELSLIELKCWQEHKEVAGGSLTVFPNQETNLYIVPTEAGKRFLGAKD